MGFRVNPKIVFVALFVVVVICCTAIVDIKYADAGIRRVQIHQDYAPNEILVKFKEPVVKAVGEGITAGSDINRLQLPRSLDKVNKRFRLREIKPLFKNFKKHRARLEVLQRKNKAFLTKLEKHLLRRLGRVSGKAPVPALERIYKLKFDLAPNESIENVVAAYRTDRSVEYAELNHIVSTCMTPNDPLYPLQWSLNNTGQMYPASGKYNSPPGTPDCDIDAPEAWDEQTGSSEIIVAVVDTGVDYNHRDLLGNLWINSDEVPDNGVDDDNNDYIDDVYGYDFFNKDSNPIDDHGHGTHCSGTIAARGDNGADVAGVCWNAKIMSLKFLNSYGDGYTSDAATAFYYAVDNGADIVSNSWGGGSYSETLQEAIEYAHSQGVIMVAAAGNKNSNKTYYPACYEYMMAVAATNSNDQRAPFSNYGDWVDIAAPGVDILSLRAEGTSEGTVYDSYATVMSGTSMACPHTAGILALIMSTYPEISTEGVITRLLQTTDDISMQNPDYIGMLGTGRANAHKAVRDGFEGIVTFVADFYSCNDVVGIEVFDFDLIGEEPQQITLTTNSGDSETVIIVEDSNKPWLFTGTILTSSDAVIIGDGTLQISDGQIISVEYEDDNNGTGTPATAVDTAQADCVFPEIFDVQIAPTGPEPTVTFQTSEPTTARVLCSLACGEPYVIEGINATLVTNHTIKFIGISPMTDYFFIVEAADIVENKTSDDNTGLCYAFTTDEGPRDIYVPAEYPNIQEAINRSWNGGTVRIADGVYAGLGNRDLDFLGREITVRSENGPNNCIIDCQGTANDRHRGFYFHRNEGANSVVLGLTIANGYQEYGGGVFCDESSPTLINCTFKHNIAGDEGAWGGGGMYNRRSNPILKNCEFIENAYIIANDDGGGGMFNYESNPTLINCLFKGNTSNGYGGAMINRNSDGILTNCTFMQNQAAYIGGAMQNDSSSPILTNCVFIENSSYLGAGAIRNEVSNPILYGCTFRSNSANSGNSQGGAICNIYNDNPTLVNCLFAGNSANQGGGMYSYHGTVTMTNCTFAYNSAADEGGAMYCRGDDSVLNNCILWDNTAPQGEQIYFKYFEPANTITVSSSNIQDGQSGIYVETGNILDWGYDNIDVDPCFVDVNNGDYHLKSQAGRWDANSEAWMQDDVTSPCIDAGDPMNPIGLEPFPNGGRVNMGAYGGTVEASKSYFGEPVCETIVAGDINGDCEVNFLDFRIMALHWLQHDNPSTLPPPPPPPTPPPI